MESPTEYTVYSVCWEKTGRCLAETRGFFCACFPDNILGGRTMNQKTERRKAYELIDLEQIYPGMQDEIRWAVVTNLEEPILLREYPELESKRPFLLLSFEQGEEILKVWREDMLWEKREEMRWLRHGSLYPPSETCSSHQDLIEKQIQQEAFWQRVLQGFAELTETQRRRALLYWGEGKTLREIAEEEGVGYTKIQASIEQSRKKLQKFLKDF